jgi:hypothetical protein
MKETNKYKFVRFGNINPKKQKGYGKDSYHAPPAKKGFYAMPFKFQEFFLIGSLKDTQPDVFGKDKRAKYFEDNIEVWNTIKLKYNNDELDYIYDTPEKIQFKKDLELLDEKFENKYTQIRKEFIKKEGFIWHHLGDKTDLNEIVDKHNSWIKTSLSAWNKALKRTFMKLAKTEDSTHINGYSIKIYSKDAFEVFFDEKI